MTNNSYLITYPDGSQVIARGVSISTNVIDTVIPPSLPNRFCFHGIRTNGDVVLPPNAFGCFWSWSQPFLVPMFTGSRVSYKMVGTNQSGQVIEVFDLSPSYHVFNTVFITPGNTVISRCDVLVTDANGNVLTIVGTPGTACPTWVTTPDGDCLPSQIKCPSSVDPRGFCCLDCSLIISRIKSLM